MAVAEGAMFRLVVSTALLGGAGVTVWLVAGATGLRDVLSSFTLAGAVLPAAFLLLGTLIATARLKVVALDLGYPLSFRDAAAALGMGQVGGSLFFQIAGQLIGRAAILSTRNVSTDATVLLTGYERIVGALVGVTLAFSGALHLFGRVTLDLANAAGGLPKIVAVGILAVALGYLLAWGPLARRTLAALAGKGAFAKLARVFALSVAIQIATLLGYVSAAHMLVPEVPLDQLAAASAIIMLAASLPISLGGWGVREVSAMVALGAIGVPAAAAVTVGAMVGVLSLGAAAGLALASVSSATFQRMPPSPVAPIDYGAIIDFLVPLCAATAVFFQVYVPLREGLVNVNLADPFAILGGSLALVRMRMLWPRGISLWLLAMSVVVLLGWVNGLLSFGWHEWAATKFFGWFVLLGYAACGAMIAARYDGLRLLLLTFVSAAVAVCIVEYAIFAAASVGFDGGPRVAVGLSQNRNAFAFILILALAALFVVRPRWFTVCRSFILAVIVLTNSRAGFATAAVTGLALAIADPQSRRSIGAVIVAACGLLLILHGPLSSAWASTHIIAGIVLYDPNSMAERLGSIRGGWELFLNHPIIGAGLGAHAYQTAKAGTLMVIHSTPVFILAEFGLIGFAIALGCVAAALRLAWSAPREPRVLLLLALTALTVMGTAHEVLYQRAFWLLLGAGVAAAWRPETRLPDQPV
jgi:hypothetical protein